MLAAAAATRPASRNAAANALCSACGLNRTAASTRPWLQRRRGQATYAQAGETVHAARSNEAEEEDRAVDAMAELLDAMAEEQATTAPAPAPAKPTPRKPAAITLEDILNPKHTSAPPEVADLRAFRPRRFTVPHAASPESHRLVYQKTWDRAYASLDRAFKKRQLMDFAGEDGLNVDLTDPRLRTRIPGKKPKHWKSKRLDQMSKRELIHTILVLDFDMTHPDTIPSTRLGPNTLESEQLQPPFPDTHPTLTLDCALSAQASPSATGPCSSSSLPVRLRAPSSASVVKSCSCPRSAHRADSPTIPKLVRKLGVTVAYRRNPDSGVVSLIVRGSETSVAAAKAEVEAVEEVSAPALPSLPGD